MLYIGLTGNVASGKSEVAKILREHGATIIDADQLAREVVAPDTPAFEKIVARWGDEVVGPDGTLDRAKLRQVVFSDRAQLDELNDIIHPEIAALRESRFAQAAARGDSIIVYVVPLLFERSLVSEFDKIILVDAPRPIRLDRMVTKRGLDTTEAMNMIVSQMPADLKRARADLVIENNGSLADLRNAVDAAWEQLTVYGASSSLAI